MIAQFAHLIACVLFGLLDVIWLGQLSAPPWLPTTSVYFSRLATTGGALRCVNDDKDYDVCKQHPVEMVECHTKVVSEHLNWGWTSQWECTPHWSNAEVANALVFQKQDIECFDAKRSETCHLLYTLRYTTEKGAKYRPWVFTALRDTVQFALTFAFCAFVFTAVGFVALAIAGRLKYEESAAKAVLTIQKHALDEYEIKKEAVVVANPTKKEEPKAAVEA